MKGELKTVRTIEIDVEEYMDLRMKADANMYLMNELGELRSKIRNLENLFYDLKTEVHNK